MAEYSSILLENAVEALSKLPGIGKKTALRLALHLLNEDALQTEQLAEALLKMKHNIMLCERCYNISDTKVCSICSNPRRDENTLCVVADMRDVLAIEHTAAYNGLYHRRRLIVTVRRSVFLFPKRTHSFILFSRQR